MLFNSFAFLIFFPIVTAGYYLVPHRFRWVWLLLASCYFYMAFVPQYILILFFTISVDYTMGLVTERSRGRRRKLALLTSLCANLGVLALFKYFNFFNTTVAQVASVFQVYYPVPTLSLLLPIGLSFHTFQSISYMVEVYRGRVPAERHPGYLALYVLFYPQLVAGPIERPQNLLPQLHAKHPFDYDNMTDGLRLMAWGLFKKMVIADRLGVIVTTVYSNPSSYSGFALIVAAIAFPLQAYCDFSGYSDIALGAARSMGIRLMLNFNRPFFATSVGEFWRRWNISLMTWFRDYLYIPLGGSRLGFGRKQLNILLVFLVSGLWHGANWTFVVWGGLTGTIIIFENILRRIFTSEDAALWLRGLPRLPHAARLGITFALTVFTFNFFRANTLADGFYVAANWFRGLADQTAVFLQSPSLLVSNAVSLGLGVSGWLSVLIGLTVLFAVERAQGQGRVEDLLKPQPAWVRWAIYYALLVALLVLGQFGAAPFIYFQF